MASTFIFPCFVPLTALGAIGWQIPGAVAFGIGSTMGFCTMVEFVHASFLVVKRFILPHREPTNKLYSIRTFPVQYQTRNSGSTLSQNSDSFFVSARHMQRVRDERFS